MVKAKIKFAGGSDPGRVRRNNEDALHIDPDRGIFLVVDGIGGQAAGEKAAEIAVARLRARLERLTGTTEQRIREAITMANNEILRAAQTNPEWEGMACVLTVAILDNGSAVVGHVGDSRLYQIRRGEIRKITHDHSPVGEREDNRELSEAEAMRHPRRNEVFRDVGSEEHAPDDGDFIEVQRIPFDPDSALLLCSDGLSDQVPSNEIRAAVERHAGNPEAAVRELIEAANRAGGKDNVTVLVVEGDQFGVAQAFLPVSSPQVVRTHGFFTHAAIFVAGLLVAATAAWFSRPFWIPPPIAFTPRILVVGSTGAPFTTIAAALAEARPGDTVEVVGGEYPEQVTLKTGVTLRSRVPREAILRAAPMSKGPAVLAEGVKDARIAGFLIKADEKTPLSEGIALTRSDVEVDDMEVWGAAVGIAIRGEGSPVLLGNAIHDCAREGVLIQGPSTPWILHNSLQRNKGAALAAREGARPVLVGNVFDKSALELPPEVPPATVKEKNYFLDAGRGGGRRPDTPERGGRLQ
ncbi:Protein serine/threonine phosphatase [Candidatus Sulfopaludibacter sp. SbA4]|nr:Protein serine/threonine phosphatase [Candidatus Sulfopaludibacter sp. SbA4]